MDCGKPVDNPVRSIYEKGVRCSECTERHNRETIKIMEKTHKPKICEAET
jgi:hypothetical protein